MKDLQTQNIRLAAVDRGLRDDVDVLANTFKCITEGAMPLLE